MNRTRLMVLVGLLVVAAVGFFFRGRLTGAPGLRPGELRLDWRGRPSASALLPAKVTWCPATRLALLEAVSSDTGLMIVLYERDSITPGAHPVVGPALGAGVPRPGATVAIRWVRDSALVGYRSETGSAAIQSASGSMTGSFQARMRNATGADSLQLSGQFRELPIVTTSVGCP
jgi:hypothetical protein